MRISEFNNVLSVIFGALDVKVSGTGHNALMFRELEDLRLPARFSPVTDSLETMQRSSPDGQEHQVRPERLCICVSAIFHYIDIHLVQL